MDIQRNTLIKPFKIMIVDDDPMVVKTLERILFKKNYLFFSVNSGEDALKMCDQIQPDIILLDVIMENMTGYEVCEKLTSRLGIHNIPVIFLTSNTDPDDVIRGFKAGAVDYITKPFNTDELLARVDTHLELKRAREEIKMMNLVKTKFFSIMTHDIKDSFIGIKGVAEFLNQELNMPDANCEEAKKLSNLLVNDSTNIYNLLENIIEWDTIEMGKVEFVARTFRPAEIIKQIIASLENTIAEKNLSWNLTENFDGSISSDPVAFESIITRLMSNAIKYSYENGHITIEISREGDQNIITITDEGVGMSQEVAENVFRLDTPHPKTIGTHQEKGVGLGLIICKSLTEKLMGLISIVPQKHKGVQVILSLPDMEQ